MEGEQTENQTFTRITKTIGIFLLVSLIIFVASASANTATVSDYQKGYELGFKIGYRAGLTVGNNDCLKYSQEAVLTKIPKPTIKEYLTKSYIKGYERGFEKGYIAGYHKARYKCLEK